MQHFQKKPVVIEAIRTPLAHEEPSEDLIDLINKNEWGADGDGIVIPTLEGDRLASPGDWIIKGVAGEYYPCKPDIFEATYVSADDASSMNFGQAIEAAKAGSKIARAGWNGKNMWVALTPGSTFDAVYAKPGHAAHHRAKEFGGDVGSAGIDLLPHFDMRAADGSMVVGWLASQTDMLAEDWAIVE